MATQPVWRGFLRLALVSCPIALRTVMRTSGKRHFHFISPKAGHRVRIVTLDSATDEEVAHRDLVPGYEIAKDTCTQGSGEAHDTRKEPGLSGGRGGTSWPGRRIVTRNDLACNIQTTDAACIGSCH